MYSLEEMSIFLNIDDTNNKECCVVMLEDVDEGLETMRNEEEYLLMTKSRLPRLLLNLKVLPISKALKLYTTMSSTSTTNCFARMFKWKLDV